VKRVLRALAVLLILAILLTAYVFLEPYWLRVHKIDMVNSDIPPAFDGKRIVFVADIHHGPYFSIERVNRLVKKINRLRPHIILLGGDYVHRDAGYIQPCFAELEKLEPRIGTFGVLGNHDHWEGAALTRQGMREAGIVLLDNRAELISIGDQRIKVGGVGDLWEDTQDLAPTLAETQEDDFVILLSHNPDYVEEITMNGIDLVLSGHTHGGQITLFG